MMTQPFVTGKVRSYRTGRYSSEFKRRFLWPNGQNIHGYIVMNPGIECMQLCTLKVEVLGTK